MEICRLTYEQLASALEERAANRQTITYNDLANELGLPKVNNLFPNHPLKAFFEQQDVWDAMEQRPFRTAVVVQKATGRPGPGFFRSIFELRGTSISAEEEESFWLTERDELFDYYAPNREQHTITIKLSPSQFKRLHLLAEDCELSPQEVLEGNLTKYLASLEEEHKIMTERLAAAGRGEYIEHDEVVRQIEDLLKGHKLQNAT